MEDPHISTIDLNATGLQATGLISHYGFIAVEGEDARDFLQSQFSADIAGLAEEQTVLTGWHDRKGRALCCLKVVRKQSGYWLALPATLVADILAGLGRYVLRSKLTLTDASQRLAAAGVIGPDGERHEIFAAREQLAASTARHHEQGIRRIAASEWELLDIRAGLPEVYSATSGQFTGQMLNLDLIGGISFNKGCYPGQEVIARTHHLGRVKRRMQRYVSTGDPRKPGEDLLDRDDRRAGQVVRSASSTTGSESLVVASADEAPPLFAEDGSELGLAALPYSLL